MIDKRDLWFGFWMAVIGAMIGLMAGVIIASGVPNPLCHFTTFTNSTTHWEGLSCPPGVKP